MPTIVPSAGHPRSMTDASSKPKLGVVAKRPRLALLLGDHAALSGMSLDALNVVNAFDILVLVVAGPGRLHGGWIGLTILLSLAGIAVLA